MSYTHGQLIPENHDVLSDASVDNAYQLQKSSHFSSNHFDAQFDCFDHSRRRDSIGHFPINLLDFGKIHTQDSSSQGLEQPSPKHMFAEHIFSLSQPFNKSNFLQINLLINDVPVTGILDSACTSSVISLDLARSTAMTISKQSSPYISANNVTTSSLGTAQGVLSFRLGSIANLVRVNHSLPIIPGHRMLLIGIDLMTSLGLLKDNELVIRLDKEHSVILQDEAEFDHMIPCNPIDGSTADDTSADFSSFLAEAGCTIHLDNAVYHQRLVSLLQSFASVFSSKPHPDGIDCPPMKITFSNEDAIVKFPPRRLNPHKQRIAEEIFKDLVDSGFAYPAPADCKFGSPIVLVTYPDHRKPRLTGNFSGRTGVNANTKSVDPNLPRTSDILEFLSEANYIATLDLPKAFWQLNVAPQDQPKTTLVIPGKAISFRRACFGLKNVPAIFQNVMSDIFAMPGVFIYIDDVIIVAKTIDEFLNKIQAVLTRAKNKRVNLGLPKCSFSSSRHAVKILGHVFCNKTRSIDRTRIDSIIKLPRPTTLKEVRSFTGAINFLRDWLPRISDEIAPIIALTKGSPKSISWSPELDRRFAKIKEMIVNHIPLALPDKDCRVLISTDASDLAIGGVIWQEMPPGAPAGTALKDRKVIPLSFYSRLLSDSQKNWSTIQKELYAIVLILTESPLSSFLKTRHLTVFTDHRNIAFLYVAPEKNRIVKRWIPILADYSIDICHTVGADNHWADMLSRFPIPNDPPTQPSPTEESGHDQRITSPTAPKITSDNNPAITPLMIMCLKDAITHDLPLFAPLLSKIRSEQGLALKNNDKLMTDAVWNKKHQLFLNADNKIVIPDSLRQTILLNIHGLVQAGHPSLQNSVSRLKESNFFWPSMIKDMEHHVRKCPACQKTANVPKLKVPPSGTLWADRPFSRLSVDTIGPLPTDIQSRAFVLVFIDSFTRYTILVPLEKLNAQEAAYALVWNVCAIFGIPLSIHSDNGPEFGLQPPRSRGFFIHPALLAE
ncbi:hypothetical protein RCL1_004081 [Eukaryota sp. TZLM3-RCL]